MMEVRRINSADIPLLVPLVSEYWKFEAISGFNPGSVAAALERLLGEPRLGVGWLAVTNNEPAGYLLAVYVFSLEHMGLTAEIDEFFILPPYRGWGVGTEMLNAAEAEFARAGCTSASLQISRTNGPARAFYRGLGYVDRPQYELLEKSLRDT